MHCRAMMLLALSLRLSSCVADTMLMQLTLHGDHLSGEGQDSPPDLTYDAPTGYTEVGSNCDCGHTVADYSSDRNTAAKCGDECNLQADCKSFALFTEQSIALKLHCRLYDRACPNDDGHANGTTCPNPIQAGAYNVLYNKIIEPVGDCDVQNGSLGSSAVPCNCGREVCQQGELCDGTSGCATAEALRIESWPCDDEASARPTKLSFTHAGTTSTGAPVYTNSDGTYIFYDPHCSGNPDTSTGMWVIDFQEPDLQKAMDLDGDGVCAQTAQARSDILTGPPSGNTAWQVGCGGLTRTLNMTFIFSTRALLPMEATPLPTLPATPAPTLEPGVACPCESCGSFPFMDIDQDGCIGIEEARKIPVMADNFTDWDTNRDRCISVEECAVVIEENHIQEIALEIEKEVCRYGWFLNGSAASACTKCEPGYYYGMEFGGGSTRRRRAESCTPCPPGEFDAGDFDDCIGGMYLSSDVPAGATELPISGSGDIRVMDAITIATRNPGYFEQAIVVGFGSIVLDHALTNGFPKYSSIELACSEVNGVDASRTYPCGCGKEVCGDCQACDESADGNITTINGSSVFTGTAGKCVDICGDPRLGTKLPTPAPTVSAKGDPHLVNLEGEHFDINHAGFYQLLRIPQDTSMPADLSLWATIQPESGKPCTTYITQMELTGRWLDNQFVQVRSYMQSRTYNDSDKFLGIRVSKHGDNTEPWQEISKWTGEEQVLSSEGPDDDIKVSLSKTVWTSKKQSKGAAPTMAGQFTFLVQNKRNPEPSKIIVRQDLPGQEHLNVAVRRLSALGRVDIGGLLGFGGHDEALEAVAPQCQKRRDGSDKQGPHQPAWKTRWNRIKESRQHKRDERNSQDNEAAASLMCVCPSAESMGEDHGLTIEEYEERGVITDLQTARLAEATWDY